MKKTTVITHCYPGAYGTVEITVERVYGMEKEVINLDGDKCEVDKFENSYTYTVSFGGKKYADGRCRIEPHPKAPGGKALHIPGAYLALPEEKWAAFEAAMTERLTDELTPEEQQLIDRVKACEAAGKVLPIKELQRKKANYNRSFNDGGWGYNPFDSYMTRERVEEIKKEFPEYFK